MVAAWCLSWVITVSTAGSRQESVGYCDLVEVNHRHDPTNGSLQFTQVIAWDWSPEYGRFDAQSWALISDWKRTETGVVVDVLGTDHVLRTRCRYYRETWTNHDPERENTKVFPDKFRRKVW